MTIVTWAPLPTPIGTLRVAATSTGVCKIGLGNENDAHMTAWLSRHIRPQALVEDTSGWVALALDQIAQYLQGQRRVFDFPLDIHGTDFQRAVWAAVAGIPYGQTRAYGEIARALGNPAAVRAVGAANGANPLPLVIPCHRVIGASGTLTGYGGGLDVKRWLLALERV